jgi:hypothetical protein
MTAMRAEKAMEFYYKSQEAQLELMKDLQLAMLENDAKMAVEVLKQTGAKLHNDGLGNVYAIISNPLGDTIFELTPGGVDRATGVTFGSTWTEIPINQIGAVLSEQQ